jgi:GxxExxY protein
MQTEFADGTEDVIAALIEVHRHLGPGLLEGTYEIFVAHELATRGHAVERQKPIAVRYKGAYVDCGYRVDVLVDGRILLELKAVERLLPIHASQLMTYMRLSGIPTGLLVNFHVRVLTNGLRRLWLPVGETRGGDRRLED